jgi:hypothetical protein
MSKVVNTSKKILNSVKQNTENSVKMLKKQKAWINGKNPWVTLPNPNKNETNKKFIRVRYNDLQNGSHKDIQKRMYQSLPS